MTVNQALLAVRVGRKTREADDICSFELVDIDGRSLPPFSAGSHVDVVGPTGITRQYSLCNPPSETARYQIAVLRDAASRGGSTALHDLLHEGDRLQISAPKNHFELTHGAAHSLLLAGGIGITPILCMAERLAAAGAKFDLRYFSRSRTRTAFVDRIERSVLRERTRFHFDDEPPTHLDVEAMLRDAPDGTHLYVCGPTGFMDHVLATAARLGWAQDRLHFEFFSAAPQADATGDAAFHVRIASSGSSFEVPADMSVVEALAAHGIEIPVSCEQGVCGTCITRVLEGEPDHRDLYFTAEEHAKNDQFTPCCSRANSPLLVLDL